MTSSQRLQPAKLPALAKLSRSWIEAQELLYAMSDEVEDCIEAMVKSTGRELTDQEQIT